ncbi:TPA: signal peptidase I [Staphylococcus delphini]|nr:signal peptidase I [Staphylococcus delphini]HEC2149093.1 signal peptidase I [Staphylococcus delphini]HEC2161072.1 signal peptidase I [Staphylococcus delphini]HEC2170963.1 signal peptidase I [Staphylococcus delphini]HEC2178748.1 signal peptidase I [Staphylococcus delphini]
MKFLIKMTFALISALVVLAVLVLFVVIPYEVKHQNMDTTLQPHDRLLVNKLAPRYNGIQHQDIVVYYADGQYRVGRVIGEAGQSVEFQKGQLYLNHTPVTESYVNQQDQRSWSLKSLPNSESDIIPPNTYLILNDRRDDGVDSRKFGLIEKSTIEGKLWIRYYPFDRITTHF